MRLAFLGGGMVAQIAHLPFYTADSRCQVTTIAESRPSLLAALGRLHPTIRLVERHEEVLADPDVDAVFVSAPRPATGPLTLAALEAGKHVLTEKPMAHSLDQARRLADAARQNDLQYHVAFMKRYDGGVQAARRALDEARADGRLGALLSARFWDFSAEYALPPPPHVRPSESRPIRFETWPLAPDWLAPAHHKAYAWFVNAISHDVNLMRFLLPDPVDVVGAVAPNDGALTAILRAGSVAVVLEAARTAAGRWHEGAEFLFERGRIHLEIPSPMAVEGTARVIVESRDPIPSRTELAVEPGWCFARQADALLGALSGEGTSLTPGADCVHDLALTEAIWRHLTA